MNLRRDAGGEGPPAWLRWLARPWSEVGLGLALIGAAAAPAFLVAASDVWQAAAEDRIAEQLTDATPPESGGVVVNTNAVFGNDVASRADASMMQHLTAVESLDEPVRTMYTTPGLLSVGVDAEAAGLPVRILARPGAVEALDVVASVEDPSGGVWVSAWLSERLGIGLGDRVRHEATIVADEAFNDIVPGGGTVADFTVVGIYDTLWSEDASAPGGYWDDVDAALMPQFVAPFRQPNFELLVADEATIAGSGLTGIVRWDAALGEVPRTLTALRALASDYHRLERAFVQDPELTRALAALAGTTPRRPWLDSGLFDILDEAESAVDELEQPIASARTGGIVIGLAVMIATGIFLVEKRWTEYRLLAGDGERWYRLATREGVQLLAPVILGSIIGVVAAVLVADLAGPADGFELSSIAGVRVAVVALAGLVAAAVVAGVLGQRTVGTREPPSGTTELVATLMVLAAAVFVWIQVGRTARSGADAVDLSLVVLPLLALTAAVAVVLALMRAILRSTRFAGSRLPVLAFMSWRRLARGERSARLVTGALGVGIGIVVFSGTLVATLERTTDAKLATEIGGATRIDLFGEPDAGAPPPASTVVRVQDTTVTPGSRRVRVVAVDTSTFADAVSWPNEFGGDVEDVISMLEADAGDDVPAVALTGDSLPASGAFGAGEPTPYRIVGRVNAVPLAAELRPTLLVSAERVDRLELERLAASLGVGVDDEAVLEQYLPPISRFRRHLVSQSSPEELDAFIAASGLTARDVVTRDARAARVDILAAEFAFDYLALLGHVAWIAAFAALAQYLAVRRRSRALGTAMMRRMGVSPARTAAITAIEVAVLLAVACGTALFVAPAAADRLAPRFDPAPRLPPEVTTERPVVLLVVATVVVVAVVASWVWIAEARWARREQGAVLRDLD